MREVLTAVQRVCAWPNLTLLPNGHIAAMIFNQPCHGLWEGDLDCCLSTDGGRAWRYAGTPARHAPGTNRMNCAAGLSAAGDLVVLCSGWSHRKELYNPTGHNAPAAPLRAIASRSTDGGATWTITGELPSRGAAFDFVPFGDVAVAADGSLRAAAYRFNDDRKGYSSWMLRSDDDGRTWTGPVSIDPQGDETTILHLGDGRWIASSRDERHIQQFNSTDDGRTWTHAGHLTLPMQITSHLLRLRDGRVLLSYGNRNTHNFGVDVRVSADGGVKWGPPMRVADAPQPDCGYPSTVQFPDGRLVTAYYTKLPGEYQYEMRAVLWTEDEL